MHEFEAKKHARNISICDDIGKANIVAIRRQLNGTLDIPDLLHRSVEINACVSHFCKTEPDGERYLNIPLNAV